jgi:hypothetical protein
MPASASAPQTSVRRCAAVRGERLVQKTSLINDRADFSEERGTDNPELVPQLSDGFSPLGVEVIGPVVNGSVPHGELANQAGQQRAQCGLGIYALDRYSHRRVEFPGGQARRAGQHLSD